MHLFQYLSVNIISKYDIMKAGIFFLVFSLFLLQLHVKSFQHKFFCFGDAFIEKHTDHVTEHTKDPIFQAKLLKGLGFDGMDLMGLNTDDNFGPL